MINCNVEYQTLSLTFLFSVTIKATGLPSILSASLSMLESVRSCVGQLENAGSLTYAHILQLH